MTERPLTEDDKSQLRAYNCVIAIALIAIAVSIASVAFSVGVSIR